jgi:hypothetical protein
MDDASAPFVPYMRTPDPAPAATGGPIAGGTYFLTALTYHGGMMVATPCTTSLVREILRFTAASATQGTLHDSLIFGYSDGSVSSRHPTEATYRTDGTTLMGTSICGSPGTSRETYSATDTQLRFIRGPFDTACDKGVTLELTFEKQP